MPLTSNQIRKIRGRKWQTDFKSENIQELFKECNVFDSIYYTSNFSLAWLVSNIFRDPRGGQRPLQLEAFQIVMLEILWNKKFPLLLACRGSGKSFLLAVYALLRALLMPGSKIVIVAAGYRQAKFVFKNIEMLYNASPIIQEAISHQGGPKYGSDAATLKVGLSTITAIPIGDGEKIRGLRATHLLVDEIAAIDEAIFDIVIKPFTAVHVNPAERARIARFVRRLKNLGADDQLIDNINITQGFGNQIVMSGTASYKYNHLYKRYQLYLAFLNSKGDPKTLKSILENQFAQVTGQHNLLPYDEIVKMAKTYHHYAVLQLPYNALPDDFLDADIIRADRAAFPKHRFSMEYLAQFPDDSEGFIRRSWVDRATPRDNPVIPELYGNNKYIYVLGLDPAKWNDNFGAVVLKITPRGKELVYCTAWNKTEFWKSAEKIREICRRFPITYIAMDKGGGGDAVAEWLCKKQDNVHPDELIWQIPDQLEDKTLLSAPGRKILELVNFSPSWTPAAAHGIAASIEQCNILFPCKADEICAYNQYMQHFEKKYITEHEKEMINLDLWGIDDWDADRLSKEYNDKFESKMGVMQNIDECVNEMCAIVRIVTSGGVEKFELPGVGEQTEGLDMRRRDRWSALVLANYAAKIYIGHGHKAKSIVGIQPGNKNRRSTYTNKGSRRKGLAAW